MPASRKRDDLPNVSEKAVYQGSKFLTIFKSRDSGPTGYGLSKFLQVANELLFLFSGLITSHNSIQGILSLNPRRVLEY
jgi:hypothetical protein